MSQSTICSILIQDSNGIEIWDGPPKLESNKEFAKIEDKIKFSTVSENGQVMAIICNGEVRVFNIADGKKLGNLQHPKAVEVKFSPQGNYLAVWDTFIKSANTEPIPNLSIYDVKNHCLLKKFVQKSHEGWCPLWSNDEHVMARQVGKIVFFYEEMNLEEVKHKVDLPNLQSFSLSPSRGRYFVSLYITASNNIPASLQLCAYPNFKQPVCRKSFFKVESVETLWSPTLTAALFLTTGEVDKNSPSYYGEQALYFLSTKGDAERLTFPDGTSTCRSTCWGPSGSKFFCVYGIAPAKAALMNMKCDVLLSYGSAARNLALVNAQGTLVILAGMGNISARFEVWDVVKQHRISNQECPDSTHIEWSPCGQYILTATCSPRLRVNNGFRVWHYTGSLLSERMYKEKGEELLRATWLNKAKAAVPFEILKSAPAQGIQVEIKKASEVRYVPPSQRAAVVDTEKKSLSQRDMKAKAKAPPAEVEVVKRKAKAAKQDVLRQKKEQKKGMDKDWRQERKVENEGEAEGPKKELELSPKSKRKQIENKLAKVEHVKKKESHSKKDLFVLKGEGNLRKALEELKMDE